MKIKVGHIDYDYREVECVSKEELRRGEVNFLKRVIKIDYTMDKETKAETTLHELIHAIDDFMSIELEEEQVKQLGCGLSMLFKDNEDKMKELFLDRLTTNDKGYK
ncbi:hypothetical protein [Bacillus solitudinis]|uniref:hypothetical protein n=1 Tax=Bacillus solitudinis TaxID=2014074 RepID=UPI000C230C8B|nr:hypothetical protein [Bacillus solitudinis]